MKNSKSFSVKASAEQAKFKNIFLAVLFFSVFLFIPKDAMAKDLFVSTTGNDAVTYANNDINNPWLTVEKAWADAQTNDVVYYRAGTYTITAQIDNLTSGANVTHTNYQDEVVTWESSLCDGESCNHGVIHISEDHITVDGINGNWTNTEECLADTGFFVMGWASKAGAADYFTLKNGVWASAKYGQNGGIVFARLGSGDDSATHTTIENIKITGAGSEAGSINTSGIMTFNAEDWTIKNCEISNVNTGIFFNKHPSIASAVGGTIENNYIHTVHTALRTQTNNTEFTNNIFDGSVSMGYDGGPCSVDGNVGSDNNTWSHNTFISTVDLFSATRSGDNELAGTVYPEFSNNVMPAANVDIHRYSALPTYYEGDYNLWPPAGTIYVYDGGASVTKTLATFRNFLGGCPNDDNECNSIEQAPTFAGGATPSTIAGFALTPESYGHQACADSSDMGADVSLVGVDAGVEADTTPPSAPSGLSVS